MSEQLTRALERRANTWEQMKSLTDRAESEGRDMSAEEAEQWDRMESSLRNDSDTIERLERSANLESQFETISDEQVESRGDAGPSYDEAFSTYLRRGISGVPGEQRQMLESNFETAGESRAQSVGTDTAGGYTVPEGFRQQITETMKAFGGVRGVAEVINTSTGNDLPWPTNDDTTNTGAILTENTAVGEQDVAFGTKQLGSYTYTSLMVKVSIQLLQDSAFNLDTWLPAKLGERLGRATAAHYATGTGTAQPEGVVTGSALGVTAAAVGAVTYDELIDLEHSVDPAYRNERARFVFNDNTLATLRKLKDTDGRPLWQPSVIGGVASTINGRPYTVDQGVADIGASARSLVFGDVQAGYVIRDVLGIQTLRLSERYADLLQVAFLGFLRTDALVQDSGAVKHLVHPAT